MIVSIERAELVRMIKAVGKKMPGQERTDRDVKLIACAPGFYVESNGVSAGFEADVKESGQCSLPRKAFLKLIQSYRGLKTITLTANHEGLRIGNFSMPVYKYSTEARNPDEDDENLPESPADPSDTQSSKETPGKLTQMEERGRYFDRPQHFPLSQFPPETIDSLFGIWSSAPHLKWLQRTWDWLSGNGLTEYSNAREYNHVIGRLIVLAVVYHEWNLIAYSEGDSAWHRYPSWFTYLPFMLNQLQEELSDSIPKHPLKYDFSIDADQIADVLDSLMQAEIRTVFEVFGNHYGDETNLGRDLRYASGREDTFNSLNTQTRDIGKAEDYFNRKGWTYGEVDALEWLQSWFEKG